MSVEFQKSKEQVLHGPYNRFLYALKAPESKRQYPKRLEVFLTFINIDGLSLQEKLFNLYKKAKSDTEWLQDSLIDFIVFQKTRASRGEITESTIPNYYKPVKLFCDMNDIIINWKLVTRGMPRGNHAANDRTPTRDEILQILKYPDIRIKPIILTMISSGIRIGAWDFLQWKHIVPIAGSNNSIVVAKVVVYAGEQEQYYSFITPEAYNALKEWMNFRSSYGEKITGDSWVARDMWKTTNITYGAKLGYARTPVKLKSSGIRNLIAKALFQQNVRPILTEGQKRHEFKTAHGFRKFFKTQAEQCMKAANVEMLMGHDLGISKSYYKPQEKEVMEDYLKAVKNLSIYKNDNTILEKEIDDLREKNENNKHIIKSKLQEKDDALVTLSDQVMKLMEEVQNLKLTKIQ
jgi:integrase